tara:strand:+ start:936 stop:1091 length:156 start_codon:yes stop_codon:yes gene_type:complete
MKNKQITNSEARELAEKIVETVDKESNNYDAIEAVQSILVKTKEKTKTKNE